MVSELIHPGEKDICGKFCLQFVEWGRTPNNLTGRADAVRIYAASNQARTEFRFHINTYESFMQHYRVHDVDLKRLQVIDVPMYEPAPAVFNFAAGASLLEPQVPLVDFMLSPGTSKLVELRTGGGKAQPLYSKIKIPGGWTTMGEVKVGDIVTTPDGGTAPVIGVFPQGVKDIYEVTFVDGRKTRACGEHLWEHFNAREPDENKRWSVMNTLDVKARLDLSVKRSYIRLTKPEDIPDVELPLDPYLLGALLGDGGFTYGIYFSTADHQMLDELAKVMPESVKFTKRSKPYDYNIVSKIGGRNELRQIIVGLDLERPGHEKYVPEIFLNASKQQRLSLLQGLMDTDGTVNDHHVVSFCSTSIQLAEAVQYLVRSLGGVARISSRIPTYTHNGEKREGRVAYNVNIRHPKSSDLFRLTRKRNRCNDMGQYASKLKLRIKSIEYVGQEEAQCIMIDHPDHLYITDDFIVTHNTFCALWVIKELKKRAAIVLKGGYIDRWLPDLINKKDKPSLLGLDPDQVRVIRGGSTMADLCFDAMQGKLDESVIVFSTDTLRLYEEHYELMNGDMSLYANIPPHYLWECLGVGVKVTDEIHQLFHANFKQDLYSHVPLTISLSATMIPSDPLKSFLYDVMFPRTSRTDPGVYKKFVEVFAMMYGLEWQSKTDLRWNRRGSKDYNQNEFEKSILKNKKVCDRYISMITDHIQRAYVDRRIAKEKCLVFCGSVEMCSVIRDHFRKIWPDVVSHRYCNADPFTNIAEAEIILSTVGSLGTAHDIADLWQVHKTVGLGKEDTNLQVIGRLREMKNFPGRAPEMYYFVCQDIDKHLRYHRVKQELFKERVVKHVVYDTGITV